MFSSIGFDARGASRFFPSAPRGFSVHVFKNSSLSSQPPPAPMAPVAHPPKFDTSTTQSRTSNSAAQWSRQQSYRPPQHDPSERKQLPLAAPAVPPSQDRRLVQVPATNPMNQAWPVDTKLSKSQKGYGIYPSLTSDIYIYERSITSASYDDELASSPSSDSSSSDSDHFPHTATFASLEISSTRASSSTETLESTLTVPAPGTHRNVVASAPPPLAIAAPPRSSPTRPQHDATSTARPVIPIARTHSQLQRSISTARVIPPISLASTPLDNLSDSSDSDTAVSDTHPDNMVVDMVGAHWSGPPTYYPGHPSSSFRTRRDSVDRAAASAYRREAPPPPAVSKNPSVPRPTVPPPPSQRSAHRDDSPRIDDVQPRAPPGLSGGVATPPDGSPPRGPQDPSSSSPTSRSVGGGAPALARTMSTRAGPANSFPGPQPIARTLNAESLPPSIPSFPPAPAPAASIFASPPRRDPRTPSPQNASQTGGAAAGAMQTPSPTQGSPTSAAPKRNVRWNDNLVCPSPILPEHRRKGWFNRRGDQLWTNDGQYKVPAPGQEFPLDLASYPEPNTGWMNEEGVRIDMQHRLIPKAPLRSALKRHTS